MPRRAGNERAAPLAVKRGSSSFPLSPLHPQPQAEQDEAVRSSRPRLFPCRFCRPLLEKRQNSVASPVDLTSTVPPDSLASPTEPLDSDVTDDSFVPPETAGTSPATESVSGSDPAELDSFLSGEGEDGDSSLSGLGSGINAATSGTPGDFGNSSTSDPTALLSSLGFSPDDIAAAQSQQNAQNSPLTGLSWPSSLDGVSSAADPSTGASGDPAVAPVVGATSPAS